MKKLYNNNLNLNKFTLMYRALDADPNIEIRLYDSYDTNLVAKHYVEVDSVLTDAQITNALATPQTQAEANAYALYVGARAAAKAIPSWATWTEEEALSWATTNIGTPLLEGRNSLPTTLTLTSTRLSILTIITIMDKMFTLQYAIIRMIIALRNKVF